MVDHTPSEAIAAGTMVVIGDAVRIAKIDLEADKLGSLCAGGAVFKVDKAVGESTAITDGAKVYCDAENQLGTGTAGSLKQMGLAVGAAGDDDPYVYVHLGQK